jgi:hypothetical protein
MTLTNCKRIKEIDENMVQVETPKLIVTVFGKDLRTNEFLSGGMEVYGTIESVEFTQKK